MAERKLSKAKIIILCEIICILLATGFTALLSLYFQVKTDKLVSNCFIMLLAFMATGFQIRRDFTEGRTDYDNAEHPLRFFVCLLCSLMVAGISCFLPVGGWPFVFVFVMLTIFSNVRTGILVSMVLLTMAVMLTGEAESGYLIYTVSGIFSASLFKHIDDKFDMLQAVVLSMISLLFCEICCGILLANVRPNLETFVIPVTNIIVTVLLLLGILKYFYSKVLYRYRLKYLLLNDTENPVIQNLKTDNKEKYMECVHVAHFCENIAAKLSLDVEAIKALSYYRVISGEKLEEMLANEQFPPVAAQMLLEYKQNKRITGKETTVLIVTEVLIQQAFSYIKAGRKKEFVNAIDEIINPLFFDERLKGSHLSLYEFHQMKQIFKEEQLYYDFLH